MGFISVGGLTLNHQRLIFVLTEPLRVVLTTGNYNYIKDGVSLTLNRLVGWLESHGVEVLIIAAGG